MGNGLEVLNGMALRSEKRIIRYIATLSFPLLVQGTEISQWEDQDLRMDLGIYHILKPRPNDRNISTPHIPTLLAQNLEWKLRPNECNIWTQHIACIWPPYYDVSVQKRRALGSRYVLRHVASWEWWIELVRMPGRNVWTDLARRLQHHATSQNLMLHEKVDHFQIWANKWSNISWHGGQTYATCGPLSVSADGCKSGRVTSGLW